MPSNLQSKNIYAYNILKAPQVQVDQNTSFLFSTLLHLENEFDFGALKPADLAKRLMDVINQSKAFRTVDRVCFAVTHPGAQRLTVLSSHNSSALTVNSMESDYSCFVSPQSSILKTDRSNIRIYSDIRDIVARYEGKPAQRSLARLEKMGVRSGLTIPLHISELVSGMLFLNSAKPGTFDELTPADYTTLCLLKMVGLSCLNKVLFNTISLDHTIARWLAGRPQKSNQFEAGEFRTILETIAELKYKRKIRVELENNVTKPFFCAMNPLAYVLSKVLESRADQFVNVRVELRENVTEGQQTLEVWLHDVKLSMEEFAYMQELQLYANHNIRQQQGAIVFSSTLDVVDQGLEYSI